MRFLGYTLLFFLFIAFLVSIWLKNGLKALRITHKPNEIKVGNGQKSALLIYQPTNHMSVTKLTKVLADCLANNGYAVTINYPSNETNYILSEYDLIIFGSGVYLGSLSPVLSDYIWRNKFKNKKVLIEFIRKRSAEECYRILCEKSEIPVFLMTGDSSILDRKRMIRKIEALDSVILVATQVVEAGVDIDMDIGYKDISRLDSEEQFMGRINRSGRKSGIVYFFDLDNAEKIYSGDKRIEKDKTLVNKEMRELLTAKNFPAYYENGILPLVLAEKKKCNDENIEDFFQKTVGNLDMPKVDKRMQLINDNRLMKSVYLGRIIQEEMEKNLMEGLCGMNINS